MFMRKSDICRRKISAGQRPAAVLACSSLKGQLVFEFIVATVLFIAIIFFVIATLNGTISSFTSNYYRNHINEEAMRVSELLVNSRGIWAGGIPILIGLAAEWPVLNDTEIEFMSDYCGFAGNRSDIVNRLGLESRGFAEGFRLVISNSSNVVVDCSTGASYLEQAYAERFAYSNESGLVKMGVYVW